MGLVSEEQNISRLFDTLDGFAGKLISVCYLLWGVSATAAYFGNGAIPTGITTVTNAIAPFILAFALDTHAYLTARRVRAAWRGGEAWASRGSERRHAVATFWLDFVTLFGLGMFSIYNQLNYLGETWHVPHSPFGWPAWLDYATRATIVPLAFLAAAFLAPQPTTLADRLDAEARRLADAAVKVGRKQWHTRLQEMEHSGEDVTRALVRLIEDPTQRSALEAIYDAMHPDRAFEMPVPPALRDNDEVRPVSEEHRVLPQISDHSASSAIPLEASNAPVQHQPATTSTGSSNAGGSNPFGDGSAADTHGNGTSSAADATSAVGDGTTSGDANGTPERAKSDAEIRVCAVLAKDPDITVPQLALQAGVSKSTASTYRRLYPVTRQREEEQQSDV